MAQTAAELIAGSRAFLEAANAGRVRLNPEVGHQIVAVLGEMADEIEPMQQRAILRSQVPALGGHPESVLLRERQGLVSAGDDQSFHAYLTGLLESVLISREAMEVTLRLMAETDADAATGLGRQYE